MDEAPPPDPCCESTAACVFAKALLARSATCELAQRRALAERELVECRSPVAHTNCGLLASLLRERARFALRLPPLGQPLMHMQALRLQCGGLSALRQVLRPDDGPRAAAAPASDRAGESESGASPCLDRDVHRMVGVAHERHGSLTELPWAPLVAALAAWQPPRRGRAHK